VLKNRSSVLAKRVKELESSNVQLAADLEGLQVNDWARALSNQQKVVASLRKQLGRAERGWAAEATAFAAACVNVMDYEVQEGLEASGGKPGAGGSGLAGVLQQRKLKQQALKGGAGALAGTMKGKVLPPSVLQNKKVSPIAKDYGQVHEEQLY
jgi:hypothetical protein